MQAERIQDQSIDFHYTVLLLEKKRGLYLPSLALRNGACSCYSNTDIDSGVSSGVEAWDEKQQTCRSVFPHWGGLRFGRERCVRLGTSYRDTQSGQFWKVSKCCSPSISTLQLDGYFLAWVDVHVPALKDKESPAIQHHLEDQIATP